MAITSENVHHHSALPSRPNQLGNPRQRSGGTQSQDQVGLAVCSEFPLPAPSQHHSTGRPPPHQETDRNRRPASTEPSASRYEQQQQEDQQGGKKEGIPTDNNDNSLAQRHHELLPHLHSFPEGARHSIVGTHQFSYQDEEEYHVEQLRSKSDEGPHEKTQNDGETLTHNRPSSTVSHLQQYEENDGSYHELSNDQLMLQRGRNEKPSSQNHVPHHLHEIQEYTQSRFRTIPDPKMFQADYQEHRQTYNNSDHQNNPRQFSLIGDEDDDENFLSERNAGNLHHLYPNAQFSEELFALDHHGVAALGPKRPPEEQRYESIPPADNMMRSSASHWIRPQIEITPGVFKELRGSLETWEAIRVGNSRVVDCLACAAVIGCVADAELVVCPACRSLTPVDNDGGSFGGFDGYDIGGVGLGIRVEDIPAVRNTEYNHEVAEEVIGGSLR